MESTGASVDQARRDRRRALTVVAGMAALFGAGDLIRRYVVARDSGVSDVRLHGRPRALQPLRFTEAGGAPTSLSAFRGRFVVLNVWATWCVPCREEMPALDRLQAALGRPAFEVVTISIDEGGLAAVQPFFRQRQVQHLRPYLDGFHEASALVSTGIPLTLLIDREGREAGRKLGAAKWDDPQMLKLLRRLS
jgi:thiol-disulfide isomerase/thioredoxin